MSAGTEAVMFFQDGDIAKEMYFAEFEAVLDGVVGIQDFASAELQAVFVHINPQLKITGTVFFLISFDAAGMAAANWNIPLRHLLDHAGLGPDLGAGAIRVACQSACPVAWYQRQLWDPEMEEGGSFRKLSAAAQRNRLGILAEPAAAPARAATRFYQPPQATPSGDDAQQTVFHRRYRQRLQALLAEHRLELAAQAKDLHRQREQLEDDLARQLSDREARIEALQSQLAAMHRDKTHAELQRQRQQALLAEKTQEFETLLEQGGKDYQAQLAALQSQYAQELQHRLQETQLRCEELLQKREQELFERANEIVTLRGQLSALREQNHQLMMNTDQHVLDEMVKKGIVFVAYHPGIEHLVIAKDEMPSYLGDPLAFAAARCEVSEARYLEWLAHYRLPICRALEDGHYCGQPVAKVMRPLLFRGGDSDRCREHRAISS